MADRLVMASTVSGGGSSGLLGLIGGSAQETARRRGRTIKRPGSVMFGSCLQVCDGCSRPRSGLRPGSLLPHAPVRPGGGRLAGAGPPPWSRLSGMAIAFACAGRTYALPSARWELLLTCRQGNDALPACTVTARHGTGDRRDPRQGRSGPHGSRAPHGRPAHRGGIAHGQLVAHRRSSGWTAGRHGSARPAASGVRTVCGHVVSTCGRPPGVRLAGGAAGLVPALGFDVA
jgi:hypothetical protein